MSSNTLDELGRTILETAVDDPVTTADLGSSLEAPRDAVNDRLEQLVDNGLLRPTDGDAYELTENGARLLEASPAEAGDNRIDTPDRVEAAIETLSLRPDEAAAVRNAFSFLRYWGEATTAEIVDGVYTETPAEYESADRWWEKCVEERLGGLPDVHPPPNDGSVPERWRYDGELTVDIPDDEDGRAVTDPSTSSFGSVRHGIESLDLSPAERTAARVAFAVLFERQRATMATILEETSEAHPTELDSSDEWADRLEQTFDSLPGIERTGEADRALEWAYSPSAATP
ncbi:hypothetical protein OB919_13230 [Halobacteria archaeon AArc-curdl1]|uniref:Uncharacterized protein n=1 Tax=Natronosalvus hydrolyticus TaxID=2979988 RepID=A0AAP2Z910_9EURY|nr:hypothetical protein [Halobacteria archaeon AArc-curdl1]